MRGRLAGTLLGLTTLGWCGLLNAAPGDFVETEVETVWQRSGDAGSNYGWAIADIPDVDGDGVAELAVGAPEWVGASGAAGRIELLSGADGSVLWTVEGEPDDRLGFALAAAGDVDGDGTPDVILGAPAAQAGRGRIAVHSGVDGGVLLELSAPQPDAFFGSAVAAGGDLDGDGQPDLIVGGDRTQGNDLAALGGAVWALDGADGSVLWIARGSGAEKLGSAAAFVGDLDGDGTPDPFVGASDAGTGKVGAARLLDGVDGAERFGLSPDADGGEFGRFFVAPVGDLDGDGTPDLYVGDFAASSKGVNAGRIHLYSGNDGAPLETIEGAGPSEGFGPGRGAGDVDFDGVPDLIVGAYSSSVGAPQAGRVFVLSVATGELLRSFTSLEQGEQLGFDAVGLGDVDGDGDVDFAVSAANGDNVYVLAGRGGGPSSPGGDTDGERPTSSGSSPGDAGPDPTPGAATNGEGCSCQSSSDASRPFGRLPDPLTLLLVTFALTPLFFRRP